jgi:hypothetical protein
MMLRRVSHATPFEQIRLGSTALLVLFGVLLLGILVVPRYDRALVLSGRTEVLSMRLDDDAFGDFELASAIYRPDPDSTAVRGRLHLKISPDTTVRFVRAGRGALRLTFAASPSALAGGGCATGLLPIGSVTLDGADGPLCDAATVIVNQAQGNDPLVVGLSGGIVVGEEVSQGAGARPLLLEATASLLVKHSGPFFRHACSWETLENLCDRFVANSVVLSPGDSVQSDERRASLQSVAGIGFIRIDPNEIESGMLFNLAAPASAFQVQRMQGETFTVRESLFDVIEKSPVVRTLNAIVLGLGLIWYFLRLMSGRTDEAGRGAAVILLGAIVSLPIPARAQQALLRADEVGQGLLRSRGDRCYAVTPSHVMGAETSALVTAPGRERGEGDLLRRIPAAPEAIVLITLRGIPLTVCPPFEGVLSLDDVLRAHAAATLQLVRADGSIDRIALMLGSIEVETLEIRSDAGNLEQGMSGGTVLVADQPVGLLVDVSDEGHVGRVARLDRIFERLAPHLAAPISVMAAHASEGSLPYDIVRTNAEPVEPRNKVSSLLGDGAGPWRVWADRTVDLVLKLGAPFTGITLDLSGLSDPPQAVEILGGRSERGPWQSLASISIEPGDGLQTRQFPPIDLRFVLLRAYAPATRRTLAIGRISIAPK